MIEMKKLKAEDCNLIVEWNAGESEEFLYQWTGPNVYSYPLTADQIITRLDLPNTEILLIFNEDEPIGTIELSKIGVDGKSLAIKRFLIKKSMRNSGFGQKILYQVGLLARDKYNLREISLNVLSVNSSAIECYKNVGFEISQVNKNMDDPKKKSYRMILKMK